MKIYEIYDAENELSVGTLLYYEKERKFIIELQDYLDEWTAPLLFTSYVKQNDFTIPSDISYLWVKERVIPPGRQNINSILATHKLKAYDEMTFLEISEGKCSQDMLFIRKLNDMPAYVKNRIKRNLVDCTITEDAHLLCFFANEVIKKVDLSKMNENAVVSKVKANQMLLKSAKVGTGGYSIIFNDTLEIPANLLWENGEIIPLSMNDFIGFVQMNILDTSECCDILQCSRQNISYMVKEGFLEPVKENVKGNLYRKGEVLKNQW